MTARELTVAVCICSFVAAAAVLPLESQAAASKPAITPDDYGKWEELGRATLSDDGRWMVYPITRLNEENELRIRRLADDSLIVVPYGTSPAFSDDGRWLAYSIGVSPDETKRLEGQDKPVRNKLGVRDLGGGDTLVIDEVASFSFSHSGVYLAMRRFPLAGRESKGVDLVIRDMRNGVETNFGNVSEYQWQENGDLLAMLVDAEGRAGNGVQVYDPATGILRTLDSESTRYTGISWREESDDLAVLRARVDSAYEDSTHVILAWRRLGSRSPASFEFDPAIAEGFPADTRVVDYRELRWSNDGETVFFGIKDWDRKTQGETKADTTKSETTADSARADSAEENEEEPTTVLVWHASDIEIIPEQEVRADRTRRENYLAAWHLSSRAFVQLGNELTEDVSVVEGDRLAVGTDRTPYDSDRMFGPEYRDIYVIDVQTGERTKIKERVEFNLGASSGGRYLLYLENDHIWTYEFSSGRHTNITEGVPTAFVNLEDDHTVPQKPPFGVAGWSEGDRTVLLYDKYDIWELRPDGSRAVRLTEGAADSVRNRRVWLDPEAKFLDTSEPIYVYLYGEWSKKYGYGILRPGGDLQRLVWLDADVGRLTKAEDADVYAYVVQDFDDSPDYFVAGPELVDGRQVTETNPFQGEYAWGRSELIEYRNTWGRKLQGALFYPANYEPGRRYPMIVYIYEIRSPSVRTYSVPSNRSAYNTAVFTSQGYFVLQPDIVYRDRNPGLSAVAAIEPAVRTVLETGMIDPERVGLMGHSWGGYQTAFTVTQSDLFAAAVAGAPLTNLVSMYLSVYWNSGSTDARIFEISQGRMEVPFWEDTDSYIANSPVFHIENMNTPLLVAHGTEDGAVDFNQGVEFYNAARRAGKDFVLLVYEGENHSNSKKSNQIDYHTRVVEWFGHYLKDEPAPQWISEGVSYLEQQEARKKEPAR